MTRTGTAARWGGCFLFLAAHAMAVLLIPVRAYIISYLFMIAAPWVALAVIFRQVHNTRSTARAAWILFASALLLWDIGTITCAWCDVLLGMSRAEANIGDFFYITYGVLMLAALALPDERTMARQFVWLDTTQAVLATMLCYVATFSTLPFSTRPETPLSMDRMVEFFTAENALLLAIGALRATGQSRLPAKRSFDRTIFLFLLIYGLCAETFNGPVARAAIPRFIPFWSISRF